MFRCRAPGTNRAQHGKQAAANRNLCLRLA
jgi:hypothetical protein